MMRTTTVTIRKFNSNVLTFNNNVNKTPNHLSRWFNKPRNYEGDIAQVASPGQYIPRVHRDAKVDCKVLWLSDKYLDGNGRVRVDVAFSLCIGEIDGVIRIEADDSKIPIYNYLDIDDVVTGHQFYKSLEILTGADDQSQSSIMKKHLGDDDTPYYRGLAYFVLKGFKMWKFGKTVPNLRAVVIRNIEEATEDRYADESTFYKDSSAHFVSSITGDPDDLSFIYTTASNGPVYKVELSTNTWTNIGSTVGGTNVTSFNALRWFQGALYISNNRGLHKYSGTGTSWDTIHTNGNRSGGYLSVSPDDSILVFKSNITVSEFYTYDGNSVVLTNYNGKSSYNNVSSVAINNAGEIYLATYKSISDGRVMKFAASTWLEGTSSGLNIVNSKSIHVEDNDYWISNYSLTPDFDLFLSTQEWVENPGVGDDEDYEILDDTTSRVSDIDKFSGRWHITRLIIGDHSYLYRLEKDLTTVTEMPAPAAASAYYSTMVQKVGGRLFVGTNGGFWEAGDA